MTSTTTSRNGKGEDREIAAIKRLLSVLITLPDMDARRRVLEYVALRLDADARLPQPAADMAPDKGAGTLFEQPA